MQPSQSLWYKQPAANWEEALPIGNGRMGAMIFGGPHAEQIELNEDSLWYGGPRDRNNPDAPAHLEQIRSLLLDGQIAKAEQLAEAALTGVPESQRHYEPLGSLNIFMEHDKAAVSSYERSLDLDTATAHVTYKAGGTSFQRDYFANYKDQTIVVRFTASQDASISMKVRLDRTMSNFSDSIQSESANSLSLSGITGGEDGISFSCLLQADAEGGNTFTIGNHLFIEKATTVTLSISAATSYRFVQPEIQCMNTLADAVTVPYEERLQNHILDYQSLFHRVSFQLGETSEVNAAKPTDERLQMVKDGHTDLSLISLYFQFGRYLLISSSRPGSLPANLQGIWNPHMLPPWGSKFTININLQMNYWPAEVGNLTECHEPLFDHIERMRTPGRHTATAMYQCRGFTAHHNTDIWADTAPQDLYMPATIWPLGAAWLSLHLWEHYEFTKDTDFLQRSYATLKEAALFFVDYLIKDEKGRYITCPSVSPENTYILPNGETGTLCAGPSMDSQIIHALFSSCIMADEILELNDEYTQTFLRMRDLLPEPEIGAHGQLMEWAEDYEEAEPGHRHISHLFALHPGNQISPIRTPELAEAAQITLERRLQHGGGHTGWSRAWIINMWARLYQAEKAGQNVLDLLTSSTLPNLLDNHPPFQIDGNFGGTAGIAEMIIQSHEEEIHLLPSLPAAWSSGTIRGLKARGGFEVSLSWHDNKLTSVQILSKSGDHCKIRYKLPLQLMAPTENITTEKISSTVIAFKTRADEIYTLELVPDKA